ncbi:MAG TPA: SpoIID/LytB domain-containing protein [Nevskiaceae bacterium]|nr:SpoIID/LytB domain-containing protein [Nevskiaceae bacterium]
MKIPKWLLALLVIGMIFSSSVLAVCEVRDYSSPEEYQKAIEECQEEIDARMGAHSKNKQDLANLEAKLATTQKLIESAERQINNLDQEIFNREVELGYQKEILAARVRSYYKRSRRYSPFLLFLASANAADLLRELSYRQTATNEDKKVIVNIGQDLKKLTADKKDLEESRSWLTKTKNSVGQQAQSLKTEVEKVEGYFSEVSATIGQLIAKQKALLAEKTGTFQTSVGEVPLADDPNARPDYDPGFRPAFAAFSFGAPHFKGMSQYGAFGRAKNGQSAEDILRAYYGGGIEIKKDYSTSIMINVEGYGAVDIETYTHRIYEVPNSWGDQEGMAALKAQAVAARSYALARTNNGAGSICATEYCQVYKPTNKGGNWERAVNETRGWVLMANGQPFSAWYASTSGGYQESYTSNGYSTPGFWDTNCGNQSCWTEGAWEKIAGSPWFYKGWYKSRSGKSCGHSHPWLTSEEMADMVNAAAVYQNNKTNDEIISHIWQEDNCYPSGADVWSKTKMREEAAKYGAGASSVNDFSITYSTGGITSKVVFQTDKGSVEIEGLSFYKAFNRRAPGAIHLKSALFNIEKK